MDVIHGSFLTSDGCAIEYTLHSRTEEECPRLVLVHSLAASRRLWDRLLPLLSMSINVLTYDCRGHGQSGHGGYKYSPYQFADDLSELLKHVRWKNAIVAGCSMGGCVSIAFASKHPEQATALGVIDSTAWFGPEASATYRKRASTAEDEGFEPILRMQIQRWFSDSFYKGNRNFVDPLEKVFMMNDLRCYRGACEMLGDLDLRSSAAALRLPAVIIVGENDKATPVSMAMQLHESIPNSKLTIIKGAAHLTPVERPEEVANALLQLVESVKRENSVITLR